jgi:predicted amidophosphoribosyltransferase
VRALAKVVARRFNPVEELKERVVRRYGAQYTIASVRAALVSSSCLEKRAKSDLALLGAACLFGGT